MLVEKEIITKRGSLVDASFTYAPRQRHTGEENKTIENGQIPEEWKADTGAMKHILGQKDTDARWAKNKRLNSLRVQKTMSKSIKIAN